MFVQLFLNNSFCTSEYNGNHRIVNVIEGLLKIIIRGSVGYSTTNNTYKYLQSKYRNDRFIVVY